MSRRDELQAVFSETWSLYAREGSRVEQRSNEQYLIFSFNALFGTQVLEDEYQNKFYRICQILICGQSSASRNTEAGF